MTASSPSPTWGHIDAFCAADGWEQKRTTDHYHWEKVLPTGEVLRTHRSMAAGKSISRGIFSLMLREQLQVTKEAFWEAIRTGEPVDRPVPVEALPMVYEPWVIRSLAKYGLSEDDVRAMSPEDAEALLREKWSQPQ